MDNSNLLKLDSEKAFVWYLTDKKFNELHESLTEEIDWEQFRWEKALTYARRNRVLYRFCQEALEKWRNHIDDGVFCKLNSVLRKGEGDLTRLRNTLTVIKDLWDGKVNYYIIKTRDDAPTCDADVLFMNVEDYESAVDFARNGSYNFIREEPFKGWIHVENGIKIELHHGISWFGMQALDDNFIACNPRSVKLMGQMFQTLNEEAEFASDLAHLILDIQPLTLDGFSRLISNIEKKQLWNETMFQADKYGWAKQLKYYLSALNGLCENVYSCRLEVPIKLSRVSLTPSFPFWIPIHVKIPFLMKKVLHDNIGSVQRLKMLQLAIRRYVWSRMWS